MADQLTSKSKKCEKEEWSADPSKSVIFKENKGEFGGLSNMAPFPLSVNDIPIRTSEALFQAIKFSAYKEIQQDLIEQASPIIVYRKKEKYAKQGKARPDWGNVNVDVMRWCLHVKLAQNWEKFSALLLETGERSIIEKSDRDDFWGAKMVDEQTLCGDNMLGRLLMELRDEIKEKSKVNDHNSLLSVEPPAIPDFYLYGHQIKKIIGVAKKSS
jgi:type I restriction enzyme, S subunit